MLYEIKGIRQHKGEFNRRWFFDPDMDLTVWSDDTGRIQSFQLCYDKNRAPHALTWKRTGGFFHSAIDDGDDVLGRKKIPILVKNGFFDHIAIAAQFKRKTRSIDPNIASFVYEMLCSCSISRTEP